MNASPSSTSWNPLATKGRFFVWSLLAFGVPCAVVMLAWLGRQGDYAQWIVVVMLSLGASQAWAALMWPYMRGVNERFKRAAENAARKD